MNSNFSFRLLNAFIIASGVMLFSACGNDDDSTPAVTSNNTATASIDGTAFTSTAFSGHLESFLGDQLIELKYINQGGDTLILGIDGTATSGEEFHYDNNEFGYFLNYNTANGREFMPGGSGTSGHMKVTLHDKNARVVKGTFNGKLKTFGFEPDSVNITNGIFEGKY